MFRPSCTKHFNIKKRKKATHAHQLLIAPTENHRPSFTCRSQQSRSLPNLHKGQIPNSQKPPQPKERIKTKHTHTHTPKRTQDHVPVGAPFPVGNPWCAPPLPGQRPRPAPCGRERQRPRPTRGVGGAAELFLVLTVLTPRGAVPGGSSECGCSAAAAASPVPVPRRCRRCRRARSCRCREAARDAAPRRRRALAAPRGRACALARRYFRVRSVPAVVPRSGPDCSAPGSGCSRRVPGQLPPLSPPPCRWRPPPP